MRRNLLPLLFLLIASLPVHAALRRCDNRANPPNRYVPCEVFTTFVVPGNTTNPYTAYEIRAEFSNPATPNVTVYGYVESVVVTTTAPITTTITYRFRFNPMTDGSWTWLYVSNPAGLVTNDPSVQWFNSGHATKESGFVRRDDANGFPGRIVYDCFADTPAGGASECPPETNIPNGVDHPLFWGQTYYQIINNAATGSSSWQGAVTGAKSKGYRKIRLLVYPWRGSFNGTYDIGGVAVTAKESTPYAPISTSNPCNVSSTQINLAHFNTLDAIINYMYTQRMTAELIIFKDQNIDPDPTKGNCGQTFFNATDDTRYARYVVSRYAAFPNVTFSMSNEWQLSAPPYTTTQWNTLGEALKPYDPFRIHPRSKNLRLMAIHPRSSNTPDPGLAKAQAVDINGVQTGWMVHISQQWSRYHAQANPGSTLQPDQWGNELLSANASLGMPIIDDEFGYLVKLRNEYGAAAREKHRNAIWGMSTSTVYGTDGDDTLASAQHPQDLIKRSEWKEQPDWNDFYAMYRFFTDQTTPAPLGEVYKMRRRLDVFNDPSRGFLIGFTNLRFVLYDVKGSNGANFAITLPTPPAGQRYRVWAFDPSVDPTLIGPLGGYTQIDNGVPGGTYTIDHTKELPHDTVIVIKPVVYP